MLCRPEIGALRTIGAVVVDGDRVFLTGAQWRSQMHRQYVPVVVVLECCLAAGDSLEGHVAGVDHHARERRRVGKAADGECRRADNGMSRPVESHRCRLMLEVVSPDPLRMRGAFGRWTPHDQWCRLERRHAISRQCRVHLERRKDKRWPRLGNFGRRRRCRWRASRNERADCAARQQ